MPTGRFAPSPTGDLHLGNLRTALVAWLFARSSGSSFLVRMEDLDEATARPAWAERQLADLAALGLDWDGPVLFQSTRLDAYAAAIARLVDADLTYPCYCSRREIQSAVAAPHGDEIGPDGAYPGTCRDLGVAEQAARAATGRPAALRVRAGGAVVSFVDRVAGPVTGAVDDFVLRRGDGTPAYNLAVVVDDGAQGVGEVVRADDLLSSTPRHLYLADRLGQPRPSYAHVPLVLGPDGSRLAKRHGAVTLADLAAAGEPPARVLGRLATSLGLAAAAEPVTMSQLLARFDPGSLPRRPWTPDL